MLKQSWAFKQTVVQWLSASYPVRVIATDPAQADLREKMEATIAAMREGVEIIAQSVLWNDRDRIHGVGDLLVRSDILASLCPIAFDGEPAGTPGVAAPQLPGGHHYLAVDAKFATLTLLRDGSLSRAHLAYIAQNWAHNEALGQAQGYTPPASYLIGRDLFDRIGRVPHDDPGCAGWLPRQPPGCDAFVGKAPVGTSFRSPPSRNCGPPNVVRQPLLFDWTGGGTPPGWRSQSASMTSRCCLTLGQTSARSPCPTGLPARTMPASRETSLVCAARNAAGSTRCFRRVMRAATTQSGRQRRHRTSATGSPAGPARCSLPSRQLPTRATTSPGCRSETRPQWPTSLPGAVTTVRGGGKASTLWPATSPQPLRPN